ncbi:MAG: signal recognition particle protein Srp19 [Desulfurococcales archaeon]|nr:signal recognition particle protein Srp19 [Desulfurococcales archaeon]
MSRDYKGRYTVVYPSYIDSRLPRRLGRKIPRELAVPGPRLDEIYEAAKELGLEPIVDEDASYPRTWFHERGRVIVEKKYSKLDILKNISKYIINKRKKSKRL